MRNFHEGQPIVYLNRKGRIMAIDYHEENYFLEFIIDGHYAGSETVPFGISFLLDEDDNNFTKDLKDILDG